MRLFLTIILLISSLSVYPQLKLQGKLRLRDDVRIQNIIEAVDTVFPLDGERGNYSLIILRYSDTQKIKNCCLSNGISSFILPDIPVRFPIYFNPQSPQFFHSQPGCPNIGSYRKLDPIPLGEFLDKNSKAAVCNECVSRDHAFFHCVQYLLTPVTNTAE